MSRYALTAAAMLVPLAALAAAPAEARIRCVKGYQIVNGQPISTPYCQDALVADVARDHGSRVSADAIRNNPNLKRRVCRFVGSDIRVTEACMNENVIPHISR
jgi:hypothetical protein